MTTAAPRKANLTRPGDGDSPRTGAARVLALSHRQVSRAVWCSAAYEAQDVLAEVTGAEILAPSPLTRGKGAVARMVRRGLYHTFGLSVAFDPRVRAAPLREPCDVFVCYVQRLRDLALLTAIPNWRRQCARAVCWIEELWSHDFDGARWNDVLGRFDLIATHFRHALDDLRRHAPGVQCEWLPGGVDALRFSPTDLAAPRPIDVFAMGRRAERAHRELLRLAETRGWTYLFDTLQTHNAQDVLAHRIQTAALIRRSRYFLVGPAKIDAPNETGGREEIGMRYFEGAAAGAVLIGAAPRAAGFAECFPWSEVVIPLPSDTEGFHAVLEELERNPVRVGTIRRTNVVQSLRRHDWAYRWQQILRWLDLPSPPALDDRFARLAARAEAVERAGPATGRTS